MNKLLIVLCIIPFLTSCYVKNGCLVSPQDVVCFNQEPSPEPIAYYQKIGQSSDTNASQRWRDAVTCGAKYGDKSLRSAMIDTSNGPVNLKKRKAFRSCMKDKGYLILSLSECYTDGKLNGKCV